MPATYRYRSEPVPIFSAATWRRGLPWVVDQLGADALYDTLANRPAAGALGTNSVFFATDTGECFRTNGFAWSRVGWSDLVVGDVVGAEATANKGVASGYAGLNAGGHVPQAQLGTGSAGAGGKFLADDQTYKTVAAGGGGFTKVFDSILGAPATSIDTGAGGVAATADLLLVVTVARTTEVIAVSSATLRFNADATASYDRAFVQDSNAAVSGGNTLAQTSFLLACPGSTGSAGAAGVTRLEVPGYAEPTFHKIGTWLWATLDNVAANARAVLLSTRWRNTAAISRVTLAASVGNLDTGSRLLIFTA